MDSLFKILHRNPFGIILIGIVIGIIIGYDDLHVIIPVIIIVLSWAQFLFLKFYGKSSHKSLKLRNLHWLWSFTLFIGVGMLSSNMQYPDKYDLNEINDNNYAYASIQSIENTNYSDRLIVEIENLVTSDGKLETINPFRINLSTGATELSIGDIILFPLNLKEISNNDNYQGFDYASYMLNKGILYQQYCRQSDIVIHSHRNDWRSISISIRDYLTETIEKSGLSKPTREFLITMLLGDKSYMPDITRESFNDAGIAHILALSGLHVGIIIVIITFLLTPLYFILPKKVIFIITIIIIWLYAFITGLSPSVLRASTMASFYLLSLAIERQNSSLNSLYAATSLILLCNPNSLFDVGLQLSVVTVACIIIFSSKLNFIDGSKHKLAHRIVSTVMTSLIAVGGSWILTTYYFHSMPLMFIPANTIVVPLLPIYISIALTHLLLSLFGIHIDFLISLLDYGYKYLIAFTELLSFDGSVIENIWVSPLTICFYFAGIVFLAFWLTERRRVTAIYLTIFIIATILSAIVMPTDKPKDGFIVQNRWNENLIRIYKNGRDSLYTITTDTISKLTIYGKNVVCIDDNRINPIGRSDETNDVILSQKTGQAVKCDYLLVCKGYRGNILQLINHYDTPIIVLMPEIYNRKEQSLIDEAHRLGVTIHSIENDGALSYFTK